MAQAAADSGLVAVNTDDTILSSKVLFNEQESVLLLTATHIICREFAGRRDTFVLPLDQLLGMREDITNPRAFVILCTFANPHNPAVSIQQNLRIVCSEAQEAHEWLDTAQAVLTDRNIRSINAQEQEQQRRAAALTSGMAELADMFPGVPADLVRRVLEQHNYNVDSCIEPLLAISDPSSAPVAAPVPGAVVVDDGARQAMQVQIAQDELFARMLADQLFHEELQRSGALRAAPPMAVPITAGGPSAAPVPASASAAAHAAGNGSFDDNTEAATSGSPSLNIAESIQKMSEAAKRSLTQTYRKFLTLRSRNRDESMVGEEMTALHLGNDDDEPDAHELGDGPDAPPAHKVGDVESVKKWLGDDAANEDEDDEDDADRLVSNRGKGAAPAAPSGAAAGSSAASAAAASAGPTDRAAASTTAPKPADPPLGSAPVVPTANLLDLDL